MLTLSLLVLAAWPDPAAPLTVLPVVSPKRPVRIVIDAGHGSKGNTGNVGGFCQDEADETLVEAHELSRRLRGMGFTVFETRTTAVGQRYRARIAAIERLAPDVVISLHTDVRAVAFPREQLPDGRWCWQNLTDPGFAVLWSEEGRPQVVAARERLGRALSRSLARAGFGVYSGDDYPSQYRFDEEPGCFIDARPMRQRVYFLRATQVAPVIIIETHHALDPREVARWHDAHTHDAFAAAVAGAVIEATSKPASTR